MKTSLVQWNPSPGRFPYRQPSRNLSRDDETGVVPVVQSTAALQILYPVSYSLLLEVSKACMHLSGSRLSSPLLIPTKGGKTTEPPGVVLRGVTTLERSVESASVRPCRKTPGLDALGDFFQIPRKFLFHSKQRKCVIRSCGPRW